MPSSLVCGAVECYHVSVGRYQGAGVLLLLPPHAGDAAEQESEEASPTAEQPLRLALRLLPLPPQPSPQSPFCPQVGGGKTIYICCCVCVRVWFHTMHCGAQYVELPPWRVRARRSFSGPFGPGRGSRARHDGLAGACG